MSLLENEVLKKDQEMKQSCSNARRSIDSAVDLKGLSHKLFSKYMNYIQSQVNITIKERQCLVPLSHQRRGVEQPKYNEEGKAHKRDLDNSVDQFDDMGSVQGEEYYQKTIGSQLEPVTTKL